MCIRTKNINTTKNEVKTRPANGKEEASKGGFKVNRKARA